VQVRLRQGYTNDAHGRWKKANDLSFDAARAEKNAARNLAARERKRIKREKLWEEAKKAARTALAREGAKGEPLHWFIATFLPKRH
jgi:hypothetical protein